MNRTRRRYWRRLREPLDEWWPKGWLLLAALFVLFFIGTFVLAPVIERNVQAAVVAALTEAGFEVVSVEASGQRVTVHLSGMPEPQRVLTQARGVARGTECSTWFGPLICPARIRLVQVPIKRDSDPNAALAEPDGLGALRGHNLVLPRIRSAYPTAEESLTASGAAAPAASATWLRAEGYGETQRIASDLASEGRATNRRVVFSRDR